MRFIGIRYLWLMSCWALVYVCDGVTVKDVETSSPATIPISDSSNRDTTSAVYRVSVPQPKRPENRVPPYLQNVRSGYVYDDIDDVIHVIDPPKYFEKLKRLVNDKSGRSEREQHQVYKRPAGRPPPTVGMIEKPPVGVAAQGRFGHQLPMPQQQRLYRLPPPAAAAAGGAANAPMMKVKEQQPLIKQKTTKTAKGMTVAKVELPLKLRNIKPVGGRVPGSADLLTQETRMQSEHQLLQSTLGASATHQQQRQQQLPMEILASVRHTERLLHRQKQKQRSAGPLARQRHQTKKTHTVVMENAYELNKFHRGKEHKIAGEKQQSHVRKTRNKRDATLRPHTSGSTSRRKREIMQNGNAQAQLLTAKQDVQKGTKLLMHISELLKNATVYLPDDENEKQGEPNDSPSAKRPYNIAEPNTNVFSSFGPQRPIGKLEPSIEREQEINRLLENSANVTNVILNDIIRKRNLTDASENYASRKKSSSSCCNNLQKLQDKIACMRQQILLKTSSAARELEAEILTLTPSSSITVPYGERTREKGNSSLLSSESISKQRGRKLVRVTASRRAVVKSANATSPGTPESKNATSLPSDNVESVSVTSDERKAAGNFEENNGSSSVNISDLSSSASLLYDDVMANIRNMLQANNLKLLEESFTSTDRPSSNVSQINGEPPQYVAPEDIEEFAEFKDLERYIEDLQRIVANLHSTVAQDNSSKSLQLNSGELSDFAGKNKWTRSVISPESNIEQQPPWYVINDEGKIYQTHLKEEQKPSALIFHQFPDIPNAELHVGGDTDDDIL